jgi:ribonuclease inhibitor
MRYEIEGIQFRTQDEFERHIIAVFDLGPYYGRNPNALWDFLQTEIETPAHIIWKDFEYSKQNFEHYAIYLKLFQDLEKWYNNIGIGKVCNFEIE